MVENLEDIDISWIILAIVVGLWAIKEIASIIWSKSRHAANQATIQLKDATIQALQVEVEKLHRGSPRVTLDQLEERGGQIYQEIEQRKQEIELIIATNQQAAETPLGQTLRESWRIEIPPYGGAFVRMIMTGGSLSFRLVAQIYHLPGNDSVMVDLLIDGQQKLSLPINVTGLTWDTTEEAFLAIPESPLLTLNIRTTTGGLEWISPPVQVLI